MRIEPDAARDGTVSAGSTDATVSGALTEPLLCPTAQQGLPDLLDDEAMRNSADALFESEMNTAKDFGSWDPPSLMTLLFGDL
jgi:hypothetical protein